MSDLKDRARGRWKSLLPMLGISAKCLVNKQGPCPLCGGNTRFRFDDKAGDGTWICNHCGAGDGIDLVMKVKGVEFREAARLIEEHVGSAKAEAPKATKDESQRAADQKEQMAALWARARALDGQDLASRYLGRRGLIALPPAAVIRAIDDLPYWDDEKRTLHPAMLAKFAAPDGKSAILHRTYLAEPGRKADVPAPRRIMPGRVPAGGAVRLGLAAETMGIAEGIETALSAAQIFGVPVWAALSAGSLIKWQPPKEARAILIFGDNDKSFAGQNAAYALAYRLAVEDYHVEVRIPDERGDWNDQLCAKEAVA